MAQEIQFYEANKYISFPFVDREEAEWFYSYSSMASSYGADTIEDWKSLIVDLSISHNIKNQQTGIRLKSVFVGNPPDIVLLWEDGTDFVVPISSEDRSYAVDEDYWLVQSSREYSDEEYLSIAIIFNRHHPQWDAELSLISDSGFLISNKCIDKLPLAVNSVSALSAEIENIKEGYNVCISVDPETEFSNYFQLPRPVDHVIEVAAKADCGAGKLPQSCSDTTGILTINGIPGKAGNFTIDTGSCYWLNRGGEFAEQSSCQSSQCSSEESSFSSSGEIVYPDYNTREGYLKIHNDCIACCECDEFVELYETLRSIKNRGIAVANTWNKTRAIYDSMVADWQQAAECHQDCSVVFKLFAYTGYIVQTQLAVINSRDCKVPGVTIRFGFENTGLDLEADYVPGSGFVYSGYSPNEQQDPIEEHDGMGRTWTLTEGEKIDAGKFVMFTFTVVFDPTSDCIPGQLVTMQAEIWGACYSEAAVLKRSVKLLGNVEKGVVD